jgi:uncharacterized protein
MIIEYLALALIGIIAGLLSGLLGIGGGIFTVPSFLFFFNFFGYPPTYTIHVAIGTSLGVMIFTAVSSSWAHFLKKGIQWDYLRYYAPGIICGTVLGALIADSLPSRQLILFFSAYIFCFGVYFIISSLKKGNPYNLQEGLKPPHHITTASVGLIGGTICSILGVGGAPITVPFLTSHRVKLTHAISTSAFVSLLVGSFGTLSYLYFGLNNAISNGSLGYLYLPGMVITGIASVFSAPLGTNLAYILPTRILRAFFGVFLIIVSIVLNVPRS